MPFARVRTVHSGLAGGDGLSTHYFEANGGDVELAAGALNEFWQDLAPLIANEVTMTLDPVIQIVQETTGNIIDEINLGAVTGTPGTNESNTEWSAKQGILAWSTATFVNGSRLSARTFLPGVTASAGEQTPNAGYRNDARDAALGLIAAANAEGVPLVAVRRPGADPFVPGDIGPITNVLCREYWGVLRSRRS